MSSAGAPGGNWAGPVVWMGKVLLANLFVRQRIVLLLARPQRADLEHLTGLVADGKVRPLIERRYPLARAADAVQHIIDGHAQGKTVLVV